MAMTHLGAHAWCVRCVHSAMTYFTRRQADCTVC